MGCLLAIATIVQCKLVMQKKVTHAQGETEKPQLKLFKKRVLCTSANTKLTTVC